MGKVTKTDPRQAAHDQILALPVGDMFMLEYAHTDGLSWAVYVKVGADRIKIVTSEGNPPRANPGRMVLIISGIEMWSPSVRFSTLRRQPSLDELIVLYHTDTVRSLKA